MPTGFSKDRTCFQFDQTSTGSPDSEEEIELVYKGMHSSVRV